MNPTPPSGRKTPMPLETRSRTRQAVETAGWSIAAYLGVLAAVIALAGVGALVWWLGVATSSIRGNGNVTRDQNTAANREHWSATFNNEYQQITADQANLATLKQAADTPGATQQDRTNYLGAQLNCRQDVATYNTDAASALGHPWIPANLPNTLDSTTYCGK